MNARQWWTARALFVGWLVFIPAYVIYMLFWFEPKEREPPKPLPEAESVCDYVFVVCEGEKE
jgi:hypothetical protein